MKAKNSTTRKGNKTRPPPKLSELAEIDEQLFNGRKSSAETEATRKEWTREIEKRTQKT